MFIARIDGLCSRHTANDMSDYGFLIRKLFLSPLQLFSLEVNDEREKYRS